MTAAVPLFNDSVGGRYERPEAKVYQAAKKAILINGQLLNEVTQQNDVGISVMALGGRVQKRKVFIGGKEEDPTVTSITVRVRTTAGGRDLDLAHELEKQVALRLVR